eukprot:2888107-Karenia_brevis.AAC.1
MMTAKHLNEPGGGKLVRGGPWCRKVLPPEDLAELRAVSETKSRQSVLDLRKRFPGGSLDHHLAGQSYAVPIASPSLSSASSSSSSASASTSASSSAASLGVEVTGPGFGCLCLASVPTRHKVAIAFLPRKRAS